MNEKYESAHEQLPMSHHAAAVDGRGCVRFSTERGLPSSRQPFMTKRAVCVAPHSINPCGGLHADISRALHGAASADVAGSRWAWTG